MHPILKSHCETGNFSHGYLLVGEKSRISGREAAAILLDCEVFSLNSHPDFWEQSFDIFGLDESSTLRQKSATKPMLAEKRVFFLDVDSFDYDAAVILPEIIENSSDNCHFFFTAAFAESAPPVLRSRLVNIIEDDFKLSDEKIKFYGEFLQSGPVERLLMAKTAAADKKSAMKFLNELEIILNEKIKQQTLSFNLLSSLQELQKNRRFLFDRAPSPRMIIEHFCLTLL